MDDTYHINVAKTEFREAYNRGEVDRLLSVFEDEGFTDMSEGHPNLYGQDAKEGLCQRSTELFARLFGKTGCDHQRHRRSWRHGVRLWLARVHAGAQKRRERRSARDSGILNCGKRTRQGSGRFLSL